MRKKNINYLLKYSTSKSGYNFFISPLGYNHFLKVYQGHHDKINIIHFYGSDLDRDYTLEDSEGINTIQLLLAYLSGKKTKDLVLNNLEFEIISNGNQVGFNDNFECTIKSNSNNHLGLNPLLDSLDFDKTVIDTLFNSNDAYLAIDEKNVIVATFKTFDDYLESRYTIDAESFDLYT